MDSLMNDEKGKKLVGCHIHCLRANAGRPMFGWFELTVTKKQALKGMVKAAIGKDIEIFESS